MVKRMKYWKAGLVFLTALLFSIAASAPSQASSLAEVAQWYASVYGSAGQVMVIGVTPGQTSPTQTLPASTGTTTGTTTGTAASTATTAPTTTSTASPVTSTAQSSLLDYYLTNYANSQPGTITFTPAPATPTSGGYPTPAPAPTTVTTPPTTTTTNLPATTLPSASAIWSGYSAGYTLNAGEQQLLSLVNQQRVANNLPAFTVNLKLSYLARLRAQDMANHQNLTHFSPTYGTPPQMEEAAGIYGNPMGAENICEGPSVTVDNSALFNSPPHRANLLDPQETQIGLGVVQSQNGIVWVSELFLGN